MSRGKRRKPISPKVTHLLNNLKRNHTYMIRKRFLVVCEDEESSRNYFEALRKHMDIPIKAICVEGSDGNTQPIQVVQKAIKLFDESQKDKGKSGTDPYDQAWAIIDGDYNYEGKIHNARNKAKANGIELAITTPCFEYWVLLHFEDYRRTQHDSKGIITQLKTHVPKYDKGETKFDGIVGKYKEAAKCAKDGRDTDTYKLPEDQNPCSEIYRLIDAIEESR